jgi:hypothetical protein
VAANIDCLDFEAVMEAARARGSRRTGFHTVRPPQKRHEQASDEENQNPGRDVNQTPL